MIPFRKMHGLGNDFVVFDARAMPLALDADTVRLVADRRRGIGCDQLIIIEPPRSPDTAAWMTIRNPDGSEAEACGNATRCVTGLLMDEAGEERLALGTLGGVLRAERRPGGLVAVDMGVPRLLWNEVPLARAMDTLHLPLTREGLSDPAACSMGNPHATFFVTDVSALDIARLGPSLEHDPLFPARANIGFAEVLGPDRILLRMWERGAGITLACGSGACAALVNAARRGLTGRSATVMLDGGELAIAWGEDGRVMMTGPVAEVFTGTIDLSAPTARARAA
jgi:diaminopimelate epimerase